MKNIFKISVFILCICNTLYGYSQERVTTFGIQFKPIIPLKFLDTGKQSFNVNTVDFTLNPKMGFNFGMVIRKGFTKSLSLETGINYLSRNFDLTISDSKFGFSGTSNFKLVNYEIPVLGMVFVQLSNEMFMSVAGGVSFDIYPSDIQTADDYFVNDLIRYDWIRYSLIANVGWEYRTNKSGYFYFGASLHRPFSNMFTAYVLYEDKQGDIERTIFDLSGNYITIDFRYFFHEEKEKKKRKTKKEPKKVFKDPRKK